MSELGYKIEKIRKIKGYSQEYIAGKLDISQNAYSKWERGENQIPSEKLPKICDALEIDANTLFGFNPFQEFNNCTSSGHHYINSTVNNAMNIQQIYEKLIEEKDKLILEKDERIKLLSELLKR